MKISARPVSNILKKWFLPRNAENTFFPTIFVDFRDVFSNFGNICVRQFARKKEFCLVFLLFCSFVFQYLIFVPKKTRRVCLLNGEKSYKFVIYLFYFVRKNVALCLLPNPNTRPPNNTGLLRPPGPAELLSEHF